VLSNRGSVDVRVSCKSSSITHTYGESGQEHCQPLLCFSWGIMEAVELMSNDDYQTVIR